MYSKTTAAVKRASERRRSRRNAETRITSVIAPFIGARGLTADQAALICTGLLNKRFTDEDRVDFLVAGVVPDVQLDPVDLQSLKEGARHLLSVLRSEGIL